VRIDATLDLVATQDLSELTLDLAPATVDVESVRVEGVPAAHRLDASDRKLTVGLPWDVAGGTPFQIGVTATVVPGPVPRTGEDASFVGPGLDPDAVRTREGRGLIADGRGGMLLAAQPNGAHTLFPVNDTPLDEATYRITLTAPPGQLGVASGSLERLAVGPDGSLTTSWSMPQPTASHVLSLAVGELELVTGLTPGGLPLRSAIPSGSGSMAAPVLAELPGILAWLEEAIGVPYPFETFGLLAYAGSPTQAILEGQTLPLVPAWLFEPWQGRCRVLGLLVHEAAHQWFGDHATIARWDHKWLSEGHATALEWRWLAEHGCLDPDGTDRSTPLASTPDAVAAGASLDARMRTTYEAAAEVRRRFGAPSALVDPAAAYTSAIYDQGALALEALRLEVGDATFGRIERLFLRRAAARAASTDTFIAIASRVAQRDLHPFLDGWLRGTTMPPMPHRPDWTSGAPGASASPVRASPVPVPG
jgi:aminopeptidase N